RRRHTRLQGDWSSDVCSSDLIKLASRGFGRWKESGGEKSKFGLNSAQLMQAIDKLRAANRLDIVKLIHFHLGSQITDIRFIKLRSEERRVGKESRALVVARQI